MNIFLKTRSAGVTQNYQMLFNYAFANLIITKNLTEQLFKYY